MQRQRKVKVCLICQVISKKSPGYRTSRANKRQEDKTTGSSATMFDVRNTVALLLDQPGGVPSVTESEEAVETDCVYMSFNDSAS